MKPYLIIYEDGNGYHCNCCRNTWMTTETLEFENDEKAKSYTNSYNKNNDRERDSKITAVYALANSEPIFGNN